MGGRFHTAGEVIDLAEKLENESARFYEDLSARGFEPRDLFQALARENRRNAQEVKRTYYEAITDAIEGSFAFDVDPDAYALPPEGARDYAGALARAREMEELIAAFYSLTAQQSKVLMAGIPRVLDRMAKKRESRLAKLRLLNG